MSFLVYVLVSYLVMFFAMSSLHNVDPTFKAIIFTLSPVTMLLTAGACTALATWKCLQVFDSLIFPD